MKWLDLTRNLALLVLVGFSMPSQSPADGPLDNVEANVRPIPPPGIELERGTRDALYGSIATIRGLLPIDSARAASVDWNQDVEVILRGVEMTIEGNQFYKDAEVEQAHELLELAKKRAEELQGAKQGKGYHPSWSQQSGKLILGHRSNIDDTVQPLGLLVPTEFSSNPNTPRRLDVWLHGRDENVSEVTFLYRRLTQAPQYAPENTFVLQPWGRYSNAFRFAGEVDVLEAIQEVKRRYAIDEDRIAIRGFSMGGAGCWNLATHRPDLFFASNPGAGFCETEKFLTGFQGESLTPSLVQKALWSLYDCPPLVANLSNLPTIAYSGGIDRQKQAADLMVEAAQQADVHIDYIVHPTSAHVIHADSKIEIESRIAKLTDVGRVKVPQRVRWTTYSLRYPGAYWLSIQGMIEHWKKAEVDAVFSDDWSTLNIHTSNCSHIEIRLPPRKVISSSSSTCRVFVDGDEVGSYDFQSDNPSRIDLQRDTPDSAWSYVQSSVDSADRDLRKRPGLQGPIDDAFLSRFLVVKPTGKSNWTDVDAWCQRELEHFLAHWKRQFRGEALVKNDNEITDEDIANCNLICFGTPLTNRYLSSIAKQLPFAWDNDSLSFGAEKYAASDHIVAAVYPNPRNVNRYVVLNSGFTYREYDYLNNARQTPKLGDWAIFDAKSPATSRAAGKILSEGFFNEDWEIPDASSKKK